MMRVRAGDWPALAVRGIVALAFGILVLVWPSITLKVLLGLFAAFVLIDGLLSLGGGLRVSEARQRDWTLVARGCVEIAAGIVTILWPAITASVLLYIIALWAIVTGVLETAAAIQFRRENVGVQFLAIVGVLSVIFGLLLFTRPLAGALAMVMLIGVFGLVYGILLLALAFQLRGVTRRAA